MTQTKVLNTQTIVETEKSQRAKDILFSPITVEKETVNANGLEKFSNAYESEKLQKILDKHDLNNFTSVEQTTTLNQTQKVGKSFNDLLNNQTITPVQTEQKVLSKPKIKAENEISAKLNFRGKLVIAVFCVLTALFGFLAIFNAVDIKNANSEIQTLTTEISQSESQLSQLWQTYSNLNNTNRITSAVQEQGMSQISSSNQFGTSLKIQPKQEVVKSSNWFDKLCDFIAGIFK